MQVFAEESGAHVAVLHHAKGEYDGGMKPIPQSGSLDNLFKVPSLGLTLHRADDVGKWLGVAVVKNRGGKSDPGAKNPVVLEVDFARAAVYGFKAAA